MLAGVILTVSAFGGFALFPEDRITGATTGLAIGAICVVLVAV